MSCGQGIENEIIKNEGIDLFNHHFERHLNPLMVFKTFFLLRDIIMQNKFDTVICHTPLISMIGRLSAKSAKAKNIIYFAHGLPCAPHQNKIKWFLAFCLEWLWGRVTDAIIIMNNYDEKLARKTRLIPKKENIMRVRGVGVNLEKYHIGYELLERSKFLEEMRFPNAQKIILCATRLIRQKGVYEYIKAAIQIAMTKDNILFLLAGSGPELKALEKKVFESGLERRIKILGWRNDIPFLMRISDIFVLPTYYFEGLPVSILEAMACGKPVIATKHRGCEDIIIDGENGLLIKVKSAKELICAINRLLLNEDISEKIGKAARARIENCFQLEQCVDLIINQIDKVIL